jgi:hypothetical protein
VAPPADVRAADEDRERVAAALRIHCETGRLTIVVGPRQTEPQGGSVAQDDVADEPRQVYSA